jgi:hypothetical protein
MEGRTNKKKSIARVYRGRLLDEIENDPTGMGRCPILKKMASNDEIW